MIAHLANKDLGKKIKNKNNYLTYLMWKIKIKTNHPDVTSGWHVGVLRGKMRPPLYSSVRLGHKHIETTQLAG